MTLDHQIIEVFDKGAKNIAAEQARTECEEHEEKIRQKKTKHINALKSYAAELIRALRIEPLTFKDYNGELIELEEWRRFASSRIADDSTPLSSWNRCGKSHRACVLLSTSAPATTTRSGRRTT